jgi:putative RecB family exonuclease
MAIAPAHATPIAPPKGLSPSGVKLYNQCPLRFYWAKIAKAPDPPGRAQVLGTFVHAVLAALIARPHGERTLALARTLAGAHWPSFTASSDFAAAACEIHSIPQFKQDAWAKIERYFAIENPSAVEAAAIEQPFKANLGGQAGGPIYGVLDRLDHTPAGPIVVDYKTGKAPPPRFAGRDLDQLRIYAALVTEVTGIRPTRINLYYLGSGNIVGEPVSTRTLAQAHHLASTTWTGIRSDAAAGCFEARPHRLCDWCPYKPTCPAWPRST